MWAKGGLLFWVVLISTAMSLCLVEDDLKSLAEDFKINAS